MGDVSDIEDLLRKAAHEKRRKLIWAICTSVGTIVATTWTVSWKVNDYLHEARRANEKLREDLLAMDKKVERAENVADEAKTAADKALLYAQLAHKASP